MREIWFKEFRNRKERELDLEQFRKFVKGLADSMDEEERIPLTFFKSVLKHTLWFIEDFEDRINRLEDRIFGKSV